MDSKQAQAKFDWIKAQIDAGKTVYLATQLRITKITAKHLPMVRVHGEALEIQHGKRWIDYSYTKVSAQ